MNLPFSFPEFVSKPFAAISLLCILGMGYLYIDARSAQTDIIKDCRKSEKNKIERITKLEKDVADLQTIVIDLATRTNSN